MNLLKDTWLPIIRQDGTKESIAIWQLLDNYSNNPVTEIIAPRPDFRNSIYQLLIGIVQVAALPEDERMWSDLYSAPYDQEKFKDKVLNYEQCFEIDSDGPAFMQDYDLSEGYVEETVGNLLINLPANDHFIPVDSSFSKGEPQQLDPYWAAVALFTLQTFAPAGGRGRRVGLRGGGPLTTILLPSNENCTLWEKIWLNIVDTANVKHLTGDSSRKELAAIFPWMKATKISEEKGSELFAKECHPFHMYFGMPRRIRLHFEDGSGECELTGLQCSKVVKKFITRHSGNNYSGVWAHPLNAYGFDPKKPDEAPYSKKPKTGGITYRHWLGLVLDAKNVFPAYIVKLSQESEYRREIIREHGATLWAAGYQIVNNIKAECWYDSTMPVYPFDTETATQLSKFIESLVGATQEIAGSVKFKIKNAWFSSPKDAKGDMSFIEISFWQNTETDFYTLVHELSADPTSSSLKNELINRWMMLLSAQAYKTFDQWALAQQEDGLDMKRVLRARKDLDKSVGKMKKGLKALIDTED